MQKYSKLFGKTVREAPKDATLKSHKLLYQAGFIRESVAGRYFFLPLGNKVQQKIIAIIKEEMDSAGAQEMLSPVLHPIELWQETNRTNTAGFELLKVKDRRDAEFALGGTGEEMFVDVVRSFQISYKDLPFNIYQFSLKFRDELRARGGLLRVREFIMKDAYSFDKNEEEFVKEYKKMWEVYSRIFEKMGLKTDVALADNGYIGGEYCHEFIVESEAGESRYFVSEDGKYVEHEDVAKFKRDEINIGEELKPMEIVKAERGKTMEDGVKFHGKPLNMQIKDVLYVDDQDRFILAIIRGDYDVNELKLKHLTGSINLRAATEEEIIDKLHSFPGFISPVRFKEKAASASSAQDVKILIVADESLRTVVNAYGGNNAQYEDLLNVNIDRDYKADIEGDIAMAREGALTLDGNSKLIEKKGIEVGNIFQLGYHYTNLMENATFTDADGEKKKYYMGCYGIGVGRTLATIVEKFNDEKGIIWPENIAPYDYHLVTLGENENDEALKLIAKLEENGKEVLWDDRIDASMGEKLADADLIGIPNRIILTKRSLENGGVEVKKRNEKESKIMAIDELVKLK
jgi:prolyl-tRNA synthetase